MKLAWLALLVACKDDLGPVTDGISQLRGRFRHDGDRGNYLDITYTLRLAEPLLDETSGIEIKAACQVGEQRFVDVSPAGMDRLVQGETVEREAHPFLIHELPGSPSLCELEFREHSYRAKAPRVLATYCIDDAAKRGRCPPNKISDAGVGPTGVTAVVDSVTGEDADKIGFPAHLTIRYSATAHRDMPRGAYLVRRTTCNGRSDDTWHSELEHLRAGESMFAGQNTYRLGRPASGTRCETMLGFSPSVRGEVTEVARFCHVEGHVTAGPC